MLSIRVFWIFVKLYFGTLNSKALITEIGFDPPVAHNHSALYPFVTEEGCQSASYWLSDSLGLPGGRFWPLWQPGAGRVYHICSLTAWGCQGAHNGLCDSLGWQGGDFAFSASFLILNEIMQPGAGRRRCGAGAGINCWMTRHISPRWPGRINIVEY